MGGRRTVVILIGVALGCIFLASAAAKGPGAGAKDQGPGRDETTILAKFADPAANDDDVVQQDGDQVVGETLTRTKIIKLKKGDSVDEKLAEYRAREAPTTR
jgi:hypothetical protein